MGIIKKFRIKSYKNNDEVIKFENISLSFGKRIILENLNFTINQGEIIGLLGPNGVGKSTIFNLITGFLKQNFGNVIINKQLANEFPIYLRSKKFGIGYVPQHGGYFHELTVIENLIAISEIVIQDKDLRPHKMDYLISKFELDAVRNIKAKHLSGGQKKRLVISLALLSDPKILLLDEPFAALDVLTIKKLQNIIVNLQSEFRITVLLCDHQARDLLICVDKALIVSNCNIVAEGSPTEIIKNIDAQKAYFGDSFKIG
jgi:lipopolysaccharide export system ATP-binding protein